MDLSENWKKYAILIPDEKDLTCPVAPATELSKLYMLLKVLISKEIDEMEDLEGEPLVLSADLKWAINQGRMTLTSIGNMVKDIQAKTTDQKIRLLDIFQKSNDGEIPKDIQEKVMEQMFGNDSNSEPSNQE